MNVMFSLETFKKDLKCSGIGLETLDFKIVKRHLGKSFVHILKANDVKHHISQIQPDLMIVKAPQRGVF
jgi:hypothetical protein